MREILFKAKRIDDGEWVVGSLVNISEDDFRIATKDDCAVAYTSNGTFDGWMEDIDPDTICQYTGLTDKNGNKIWENDVVNCPLEECCGKVIWNENEALFAFAVLCEDGMFEEEYLYDFENYIEVIGNIFDNPELLGKE